MGLLKDFWLKKQEEKQLVTWLWLTRGIASPKNLVWPRVPAPCLASKLCEFLEADGFKTKDLGSAFRSVSQALSEGKVVLCIIRNLHWVILNDDLVFVIDCGGL